ncbi:MAG: hypothetical protein ACK5NK_03870 [Niabella sp.]
MNKPLYAAIFIAALVFFTACKDDTDKKNSEATAPYNIDAVQIPKVVADSMKSSFLKSTYPELKKLNKNNVQNFDIGMDRYFKLINDFPVDADSLRVYFIQKRKKNIPDLDADINKSMDKCLYMAYCYTAKGKIVSDFYTFLSKDSILQLKLSDFEAMYKDYKKNIRTHIKNPKEPNGNTKFIIIDKKGLQAHKAKIEASKLPNLAVRLCFANTIAFEQNSIFAQDMTIFTQLRTKYARTAPGQLTVVTDVFNTTTNEDVDDLSSYDMNTLCPDICPGDDDDDVE